MMKKVTSWRKEQQKLKTSKKKLKMYIINIKTIRYKPSASGNIIPSIFNYKLMRPANNLRLPTEQKNRKKQQIQEKNWSREVSKTLWKLVVSTPQNSTAFNGSQ